MTYRVALRLYHCSAPRSAGECGRNTPLEDRSSRWAAEGGDADAGAGEDGR